MTAWKPSTDLMIAAALGLGVLVAYLANGRSAGGGDVVPATLASVALTRGDGPFLDRFAPLIRDDSGRLPGHAEDSRGRAVSRYPVGPALLAAPLVWPQVRVLDRARPGWEHQGELTLARCDRMAKNAAAVLTAAAVALSWSLLRAIGLGRTPALLACLIAALGSGYWPVASQALWQHGPAAFCLAATMRLLRVQAPSIRTLAASGAFSALLVACRPIDVVFSAVVALWVLRRFPAPPPDRLLRPGLSGGGGVIGLQCLLF